MLLPEKDPAHWAALQDPRGAITLGAPIPVQKWGRHLPAPKTPQLLSSGACRFHMNKTPGQGCKAGPHRPPPWEESFTHLQGPRPARTRATLGCVLSDCSARQERWERHGTKDAC